MERSERWRRLLELIRDLLCAGNQAELARNIGKDAGYVNRLFWSPEKKGAKGIGPEVTEACSLTFKLPPGFWELMPDDAEAALKGRAPGHAPKPPSAPSPREEDGSVVLAQFDVSGGMDTRGKLILESEPPGIIQSWKVDREWLRLNVPVYTSVQNLCIVTGFGPSMKGMFNPGDPLLMDRGVNRVDHEGVFFFRVGDEGYIKILQRVPDFEGPGFRLRVISKNPDYPPTSCRPRTHTCTSSGRS